jgi:hypothetical protein
LRRPLGNAAVAEQPGGAFNHIAIGHVELNRADSRPITLEPEPTLAFKETGQPVDIA